MARRGLRRHQRFVGFREDNVIPTHAFYGPETRYNYVAELTRDANASVRLATMQMFAEWFVGIADRRDHQPRLLAYVLNFRIDQDEACQDCAAEALRAAGREMMGERQEDKLLEKISMASTAIPGAIIQPRVYRGRIRRDHLSKLGSSSEPSRSGASSRSWTS